MKLLRNILRALFLAALAALALASALGFGLLLVARGSL